MKKLRSNADNGVIRNQTENVEKVNSDSRFFVPIAETLAIFLAIIAGMILFYGIVLHSRDLTYEEAVARLDSLKATVDPSADTGTRAERVPVAPSPSPDRILPDISQFYVTVDPQTMPNDVLVEIFVTTRRAWSPVVPGRDRLTQGFLAEAAKVFNSENQKVSDGRRARIKIRSIESGEAYQYIATGKYVPDAFAPVNHFWLQMLAAGSVKLIPIREHTAATISGIVLKKEKAKELEHGSGSVSVRAIIDDVVQGNIAIGYTDPFHSSTGLNFLVTVLSTFAEGREDSMLSPAVVDTFQQFQRSVPFVAITTVEMLDSVLKGGSLDAFVIDSQSFGTTEELQASYQFIPYGITNEYPLFGIGALSDAKREALELFAQVAERPEFVRKSDEYGWNEALATDYRPGVTLPSGDILLKAQKLWKQKKDAGRPIAAVFVSDVSGSMAGSRLLGVREALTRGSDFIGPGNSIGLVLFDDRVRIVQPVRKFELLHRSHFIASSIDMKAGGGTAMYDGIVVGLWMLVDEMRRNPDTKPMLFVLTDGETNAGLSYGKIEKVVKGLKIPIHTIGYEADLVELERVSRLVEATTVNAKEGNVIYNIATLLNAKM